MKCLAENKHANKIQTNIIYQNLYFHALLKDTCQLCDKLKIQINVANENETNWIKVQYELHLREVKNLESQWRVTQKKAKENPQLSCHVISFDLPFPTITTSIAYYMCSMYAYNLYVHDLTTDKSYTYVWNETIASRDCFMLIVHVRSQAKDKKH